MDPFSITVQVIDVATSAYGNVKSLHDYIGGLSNIPQSLLELRDTLSVLNKTIRAVEVEVDGIANDDLSLHQSVCLEALEHSMRSFQSTVRDFEQKLNKMTSHSASTRVGWRDRARLHFNEKEITLFKARLNDWKQTLSVALGTMTLKMEHNNQKELQAFETETATSLSNFMGKLEMVELTIQSLSSAEDTISQQYMVQIVNILNEQDRVLKQCVQVCTAGLAEASRKTGTTVLYSRTFDEARQWIGGMGEVETDGPAVHVDHAEARGKSRQAIGNISVEASRDFFR